MEHTTHLRATSIGMTKITGGLPGRRLKFIADWAALEMLSQGKRWEDPKLPGGCYGLELGLGKEQGVEMEKKEE